ncbi:carbohydrate kinase family protein [Flexivirga meconopsidis]|uniref:carbohydrate kinase family protein n=1 Tax=Flexivirga meconopsidis TaxID=2977121 RepID=UPI0022405EBB
MRTVLVVGGANLDIVARTSAPLTTGTSNPGHTHVSAGGVGRNIAANLGRLGVPTRLVAAIGDNEFGVRVRAETASAGVDLTYAVPGFGTSSYTALLDDRGELVAAVADMAGTESLRPADVPEAIVAESGFVLLDGNLPTGVVTSVLAAAHRHAVPAVLDPVSAPKARRLRPVLGSARIHTITPTADELQALTGEADPQSAADILHRTGVERVWLREGRSGSTMFTMRGVTHLPAVPADVVDVTGAGDAMTAGYVHALLSGRAEPEAIRRGAVTAYLTITSDHTVRPDLSAELVDRTLREECP